jgi:hypothetical protein
VNLAPASGVEAVACAGGRRISSAPREEGPMRSWLRGIAIASLWLAAGGAARAADAPAAASDAAAEYRTAMNYLTGQGGVARDPEQAIPWLRKAAQHGSSDAEVQLGICYQSGTGVAEDQKQAYAWFEKAAAKGNPRGQLQVGMAHMRGRGAPVDLKKAYASIEQAATAGHPKAQLELAIAYRDGVLDKPDPERAAFWGTLALRQGSPAARVIVPQILNRLSPAQRDAVAKQADAWEREHAPAKPPGP